MNEQEDVIDAFRSGRDPHVDVNCMFQTAYSKFKWYPLLWVDVGPVPDFGRKIFMGA
jgi:hypothetical protein